MSRRRLGEGTGRREQTLLLLTGLLLILTGCARGCASGRPPIHPILNMDRQPRYDSQAESEFFYDGAAMSAPVPGTVARGELRDGSTYFTGKEQDGSFAAANPVEIDDELLARGRERFEIYCAPCHTVKGTGKGILYKIGMVPTPSFREQRLRELPDGKIFETIGNGTPLMPAYRYPIPVRDRWAIIAHLRHLQAGGR